MKKFLKPLGRGQKGFTLIELLVVVAILGILAAIIVPNLASFIGTGTREAANTEADCVQTAVVAYMADENLSDFDGDVGPATANGPEDFLVNPAGLQATYTIADGTIASATKIADSQWGDLTYAPATGWS